jgi:hypothetical protein
MTKIIFNTNINCSSCKANVEKAMEGKHLYKSFEVDYNNPQKPATFELEEGVKAGKIQELIFEAGYKAEIAKKASWLERLLHA